MVSVSRLAGPPHFGQAVFMNSSSDLIGFTRSVNAMPSYLGSVTGS